MPAPATQSVYVANTEGQGANLRRTPGPAGERIRVLADGSALTATGQEQQIDRRAWKEVRDQAGANGWIAADFLTSTPPPSATPTAVTSPTPVPAAPTVTIGLIPTATRAPPAPAAPRATDTLVPVTPVRVPAPVAPAQPPPTSRPATSGCDPSYPDFCIPPPPPDLNCTSPALQGRKNFTVRPPDPHHFDADHDGIGCESRR